METSATVASAILAAVALLGGWLNYRRNELRRDHVLTWANEAISVLQTLLVLCVDAEPQSPQLDAKLRDIRLRLSILVEQGRLFFRNTVSAEHGADKESAYRGLRPRILDHLVAAHQVASEWPGVNPSDHPLMSMVAEDCVRKFVSLAQQEVGRTRTVSADASSGGEGINLQTLVAQVDSARLNRKQSPVWKWMGN